MDAVNAHRDNAISNPLSPLEVLARTHAILCTVGFLILYLSVSSSLDTSAPSPAGECFCLLPAAPSDRLRKAGSGATPPAARHLGSRDLRWLGGGAQAAKQLGFLTVHDPHQKIGVALLALYVFQLLVGIVIHFFKCAGLFRGHRPPQNYIHVLLGLTILALAAYQAHYGLYTEWNYAIGENHEVPDSAKHAWCSRRGLWVLYFLGMALFPRQLKRRRIQK
ncbi:unnamed protein product [Mycena citricolor]|uniref:Cytochrome b561 domain-containing protein n=1 Tax=Mycena citricolor TaxID=2018698 RepID=A0AAD2HVA9_9AGAR|nr:unnamed protein product [Mycena citricolor]